MCAQTKFQTVRCNLPLLVLVMSRQSDDRIRRKIGFEILADDFKGQSVESWFGVNFLILLWLKFHHYLGWTLSLSKVQSSLSKMNLVLFEVQMIIIRLRFKRSLSRMILILSEVSQVKLIIIRTEFLYLNLLERAIIINHNELLVFNLSKINFIIILTEMRLIWSFFIMETQVKSLNLRSTETLLILKPEWASLDTTINLQYFKTKNP